MREAAAGGPAADRAGIGPKTEARLPRGAAPARARGDRGREFCSAEAGELVGGIAAALDGEAAGDVRRWCDSCERLAVVCATTDSEPGLARFAALPQIVAVIERGQRRAVGLTVEGVPVELFAAEPERFGVALVRATGSPAYVAALEPLPEAPDEETV